MTHRFSIAVSLAVSVLMLAGSVEAGQRPGGVSPVASDRAPVVEGRCPTFSWVEHPDAVTYELVVYELWDQADQRGTFILDLERYLELGGDDGRNAESVSRPADPAARSSGRVSTQAPKSASRSVLTGTAAIRGEQPDSTGEAYGVVGTSASPDGAGLGAANTGGGHDLVLDGSADGVTDTVVRESGLDRPSPTLESFAFENTGGGGMTLEIDGVEVVTTDTDRDTLADLSCPAGQLAKWNGSGWGCAPDLDTDTLAALGPLCAFGELAKWNGGAWVCDGDLDTLAGLSCAGDQVAEWNGSQWVCADSGGTGYTPGPATVMRSGSTRTRSRFGFPSSTAPATSVGGRRWLSARTGWVLSPTRTPTTLISRWPTATTCCARMPPSP